MKFLIVGASGFIGRHLLAQVRQRGWSVVGTQSRARQPDLVRFDLDADRIVPAVGAGFFAGPEPVHAVICAAVDNMDWCFRERETSRRLYVDRIVRLIDDLREVGARPIFLSTCFLFDGAVGHYSESDPIAPVNEYARQKHAVEQHLAATTPDSWTLRLDKVVGDDPAEETLFTQWYRRLRDGQPVVCLAESVLSPTYVGDVARAILLAAERRLTGLHHVANPEQFLRRDLALAFAIALSLPANIVERPLAEFRFEDARALKSSLDGSRFAALTGFRATPMRDVFAEFARRLGPASGANAQ